MNVYDTDVTYRHIVHEPLLRRYLRYQCHVVTEPYPYHAPTPPSHHHRTAPLPTRGTGRTPINLIL